MLAIGNTQLELNDVFGLSSTALSAGEEWPLTRVLLPPSRQVARVTLSFPVHPVPSERR